MFADQRNKREGSYQSYSARFRSYHQLKDPMVLESQRINVRVDFARSNNGNEAFYLSVGEAF